jgi:hypothetical protein
MIKERTYLLVYRGLIIDTVREGHRLDRTYAEPLMMPSRSNGFLF